jgi:type II secretory pathway pseudopilin PulG
MDWICGASWRFLAAQWHDTHAATLKHGQVITLEYMVHKNTRNIKKAPRGFTIIEALIVISITIIMSGIFLSNHRRFQQDVSLSTITYDVALALRQAQVYGQSTRAAVEIGPGEFRLRYGVHMSMIDQTHFYIFADRGGLGNEGNGIWDGDPPDRRVESYTLTGGNRINRLCVVDSSGIPTCSPGFTDLYITFERPFRLSSDDPLGAFILKNTPGSPYSRADIEIVGPQGTTRTVRVWASGQISVQ